MAYCFPRWKCHLHFPCGFFGGQEVLGLTIRKNKWLITSVFMFSYVCVHTHILFIVDHLLFHMCDTHTHTLFKVDHFLFFHLPAFYV